MDGIRCSKSGRVAAGISRLTLGGFFDRRGDIYIDDLAFGAATAVPEPPTIVLLALAWLASLGVKWANRFRPICRVPL